MSSPAHSIFKHIIIRGMVQQGLDKRLDQVPIYLNGKKHVVKLVCPIIFVAGVPKEVRIYMDV